MATRTNRTRRTEEQLIADLEGRLAAVQERVAQRKRKAANAGKTSDRDLPRFSPTGLSSHRERLALSAEDYGILVGVTAQTIYAWEHGRTRPRAKQLEALAAIRDLGKRVAWARLEAMGY